MRGWSRTPLSFSFKPPCVLAHPLFCFLFTCQTSAQATRTFQDTPYTFSQTLYQQSHNTHTHTKQNSTHAEWNWIEVFLHFICISSLNASSAHFFFGFKSSFNVIHQRGHAVDLICIGGFLFVISDLMLAALVCGISSGSLHQTFSYSVLPCYYFGQAFLAQGAEEMMSKY